WLIHVLLVVASVEIALGAHFVGKGAATATAATIYVWVALYAFYFFPWPIGLAHLAVMGSAYGVLLAVQHDHAGPAQWVIAMGTAGAVGAVVSVLVGRLRELAGTDLLTGLPNRRAWEQELEREVNRAARVRTPLSVVLIDLDAFKALNDEEGHPAGDRLLREIAGDWSAALRAGDLLCRHGGDEFGVVLPNCDRQGGLRTVERLRGATPR